MEQDLDSDNGGIYGPELQELFNKLEPDAVLLIVMGGERGAGFSVMGRPDVIVRIPEMLINVATSIRNEANKVPLNG